MPIVKLQGLDFDFKSSIENVFEDEIENPLENLHLEVDKIEPEFKQISYLYQAICNLCLSARLNLGFKLISSSSPYLVDTQNSTKLSEEELLYLVDMFTTPEGVRKHLVMLQNRQTIKLMSFLVSHICFENEEFSD